MDNELDPRLQALISANLKYAKTIAWEYYKRVPHATELDELVSVAYEALMIAARRWLPYCAEHGYEPFGEQPASYFRTYASRRVKGAILDAARRSDHVTRSQRTKLKALAAAGAEGKTQAELAEAAGMSVGEVREALAAEAAKPVHLGPVRGIEDEDATGTVVDDTADVESAVAANALTGAAVRAMRRLPFVHQVVMALYYYESKDLREIATMLGRREPEVSKMHTAGVLAVHRAMLAAATGQAEPFTEEPEVLPVRSGDVIVALDVARGEREHTHQLARGRALARSAERRTQRQAQDVPVRVRHVRSADRARCQDTVAGRRKAMAGERREALLREYAAGASLRAAAVAAGVGVVTAGKIIRDAGIVPERGVPASVKAAMVARYKAGGLTQAQVAAEFGLHVNSVGRALAEAGARPGRDRLTPEQRAEIVARHAAGELQYVLAAEFGVAPTTITYAVAKGRKAAQTRPEPA